MSSKAPVAAQVVLYDLKTMKYENVRQPRKAPPLRPTRPNHDIRRKIHAIHAQGSGTVARGFG